MTNDLVVVLGQSGQMAGSFTGCEVCQRQILVLHTKMINSKGSADCTNGFGIK